MTWVQSKRKMRYTRRPPVRMGSNATTWFQIFDKSPSTTGVWRFSRVGVQNYLCNHYVFEWNTSSYILVHQHVRVTHLQSLRKLSSLAITWHILQACTLNVCLQSHTWCCLRRGVTPNTLAHLLCFKHAPTYIAHYLKHLMHFAMPCLFAINHLPHRWQFWTS